MSPFQEIKSVLRVRAIGMRGDVSLWNINTIFFRLYEESMRGKLLFRQPSLGLRGGEVRVPDAFHSEYTAMFPLTEDPPALPPGTEIVELPETMVASFFHRGDYEEIGGTYEKVLDWLRENPFRASGDVRELFLVAREPYGGGSQDDMLTEIQVPIKARRP